MLSRMSVFLRLLCPTEYVPSVLNIDVADLKKRDIGALFVDLDNTLVPWRSCDIAPEVKAWVEDALNQGMKLCIVSNTRTYGRLRALAGEFNLPFVKKSLKPRRGGFREALGLLDTDADNAAVIGDQIFTDILGGNRMGLITILVRPLHSREFFGTKISRFFERIVLRVLERQGSLQLSDTECPDSGEQSTEINRQMNTEQ